MHAEVKEHITSYYLPTHIMDIISRMF